MATLEKFLETGELGPIHAGMSQAEVLAILGPPQEESRHPQILKYGGLQLTFLSQPGTAERRLAHIAVYFRPSAEPIPKPTLPADFTGGPETTITEVREFLARTGLKESAAVDGEDTRYLIMPSGARITFDDQMLQSITFVARTVSPAKKQVSVVISKDTWDQLRKMAQESNRSVVDLCAEWITQRVKTLECDNGVESVVANK
jgi:hypothetical protein